MKNIIFAGAGGFAKELYGYIRQDMDSGKADFRFKGILLKKGTPEDDFFGLPCLGTEDDYIPEQGDVFTVPVGSIPVRNRIINKLEAKNAEFLSFIHSSAIINPTAKIGRGVIVSPFSIINASAVVGDHCVLNVYCSVGHDTRIGNGAVLSPFCAVNGGASAGDNLFMGTRATIFPGVTVGDNCSVSAHSFVKQDKGDNLIIQQQSKTVEVVNRIIRK